MSRGCHNSCTTPTNTGGRARMNHVAAQRKVNTHEYRRSGGADLKSVQSGFKSQWGHRVRQVRGYLSSARATGADVGRYAVGTQSIRGSRVEGVGNRHPDRRGTDARSGPASCTAVLWPSSRCTTFTLAPGADGQRCTRVAQVVQSGTPPHPAGRGGLRSEVVPTTSLRVRYPQRAQRIRRPAHRRRGRLSRSPAAGPRTRAPEPCGRRWVLVGPSTSPVLLT